MPVERVHEQRLVGADLVEALLLGPFLQLLAGVEAGHVAVAQVRVLLGMRVDVLLDGGELLFGGGEADEAEVEEVGRSRVDMAFDEARQHETALEVHHRPGHVLVSLAVGRRAGEHDAPVLHGQGLHDVVLIVHRRDGPVLEVLVGPLGCLSPVDMRGAVVGGLGAAVKAEAERGERERAAGNEGAARDARDPGLVHGVLRFGRSGPLRPDTLAGEPVSLARAPCPG